MHVSHGSAWFVRRRRCEYTHHRRRTNQAEPCETCMAPPSQPRSRETYSEKRVYSGSAHFTWAPSRAMNRLTRWAASGCDETMWRVSLSLQPAPKTTRVLAHRVLDQQIQLVAHQHVDPRRTGHRGEHGSRPPPHQDQLPRLVALGGAPPRLGGAPQSLVGDGRRQPADE